MSLPRFGQNEGCPSEKPLPRAGSKRSAYTAECGECLLCKPGKTNLCVTVRATQGKGVMPDGTTRFSYDG